MEKEIILELNRETIESLIYQVRNQKVMLDFELAKIYGYSTKAFNQQVKNNINKFPERYRFQLTKEETKALRSKKLTLNKNENMTGMHIKYLPYAFTEQGIYMLMTVLKGDLAIKQSIALIDAFKEMKDYIVESSNLLLNTNSYIESRFSSYDKRFQGIENKLEIVMNNFIDTNTYKHYLIKDGERIEADNAYQDIYKLAKHSIYIIDNYISVKTLQLLKCIEKDINIIIFTDNMCKNNINTSYINDFKNDTGVNIILKEVKNRFHDRYIVIDFNTNYYLLYHCGASSKDAGNKINTITNVKEKDVYISLINEILNNEELILRD